MPLPEYGYVRASQLVSTRAHAGPLPFSRATLWRKVKEGTFPIPVRLGAGITVWSCEAVRTYLEQHPTTNATDC